MKFKITVIFKIKMVILSRKYGSSCLSLSRFEILLFYYASNTERGTRATGPDLGDSTKHLPDYGQEHSKSLI
jgi:hypothetical protein